MTPLLASDIAERHLTACRYRDLHEATLEARKAITGVLKDVWNRTHVAGQAADRTKPQPGYDGVLAELERFLSACDAHARLEAERSGVVV